MDRQKENLPTSGPVSAVPPEGVPPRGRAPNIAHHLPPGSSRSSAAPQPRRKARSNKKGNKRNSYTGAERLRAVKLYLEHDFAVSAISEELGMCVSSVVEWVRIYEREGAEGLEFERKKTRRKKGLPAPVRAQAEKLKKEDPTRGVRRISDILRRFFFMTSGMFEMCMTIPPVF